jgi:hypothetical protein
MFAVSAKRPNKDFAGVRDFSAENSLVVKRVLLALLGFLAVCFPVAAQQGNVFEQTINLPLLTLSDGRGLPASSDLGRMGTVPVDISSDDSVTVAEIIVRPKDGDSATDGKDFRADGKDSSAAIVNSPLNPIYYGGEVGFRYGHASGKFGGDDFATYMMGTAGNDKFQITVGGGYEEFSGRLSRWGR